jgi:hypothetical protein
MQSKSVYKPGVHRGVSHQGACVQKNRVEQPICWQRMHVKTKECIWLLATCTSKATPADFKDLCYIHTQDIHEYNYTAPRLLVTRPHGFYVNLAVRRDYSSPGRTGSTSTLPCAATTRHPAARALRQPCRAPRVLVSRPQRLYIDYAVRRRDVVFWAYNYFDYSSQLIN